MPLRTQTDSGWTLIELLAVVALASLAMVLVAVRSGAGSSGSASARTIAIVEDLDARARWLAKGSGSSALEFNEEAAVVRSEGGAIEASRALPRAGAIQMLAGRSTITYDGLGRTESYGVGIEVGGVAEEVWVNGLTGWIEVGRR